MVAEIARFCFERRIKFNDKAGPINPIADRGARSGSRTDNVSWGIARNEGVIDLSGLLGSYRTGSAR